MGERFADLRPISFSEYETIGTLAFYFFSPLENEKLKAEMGLPSEERIIPFSGMEFYNFLQQKYGKEYEGKLFKVKRILSLMERAELLTYEGNSRSALLGSTYYAMKVLTTLQRRNTLWLGEAFGFPYLHEKLKANVVHITGHGKDDRIGNGSGFLLNSNTVLTCKHVVTDMVPDERLDIAGKEYAYTVKTHESRDIALLTLAEAVDSVSNYPIFSEANTLDEVMIMGYPPITGADKDYMLSQKGEVNSVVYDYLSRTNNLVLSSITRPGNSGGPVISKSGYLVGMVTQFNVAGETVGSGSGDKEEQDRFPFYMAMQGNTLYSGIKEIDPGIEVFFEDYQ